MRVFAIALSLCLLAPTADGQTIWSRPYTPNQVAVEALTPYATDDAGLLSGGTFFSGTFSLNDNLELATELPVARYGASSSGSSSTTALGNPYVGIGFSSTRTPLLFELGARIPVAEPGDAVRVAESVDVGRTTAFRPEEFVLSGLLNACTTTPSCGATATASSPASALRAGRPSRTPAGRNTTRFSPSWETGTACNRAGSLASPSTISFRRAPLTYSGA
ncbi:MAG: hypothetical protein BRD25_04750 [Bacteroidetes bacterium QH_1_61_8]|nr:MAG: hypothetical protein BRD25_04750 [Bacteroidetes bacterium QH_1_61_8]